MIAPAAAQRPLRDRLSGRAPGLRNRRSGSARHRIASIGIALAIGAAMSVAACGSRVPDQSTRAVEPSSVPSAVASTAASTASSPAARPSPSVATATETATPPGERLDVTCQGAETFVDGAVVAAQADGVHVLIRNPYRSDLDVVLERPDGEAVTDAQVEQAEAEIVIAAEPGRYAIRCGATGVPVEVVDPAGRYISADLGCPGASGTAGVIDYPPGALGAKGDVVAVARLELRGLRTSDSVERAGYPASTGPAAVRVLRLGSVIAVLGFAPDGHGGWLLTGTRSCPGSQLTAAPPR